MDRQTLLFIVVMFIFISMPASSDDQRSEKQRDTLTLFKESLIQQKAIMQNITFERGYGNITGFELSYKDHLDGRNVSEWPIHEFNEEHPWKEDEKYSIIPNAVSGIIKEFWGNDKINEDENAYLFNLSGYAKGSFVKTDNLNVKEVNLKLPSYLQEYADEYLFDRRVDESRKFEDDNDMNTPLDDPDWKTETNEERKIGNISSTIGEIGLAIENMDYNYKYSEDDLYRKQENAMITHIKVDLQDPAEIEKYVIELEGVYFQDTGSFMGATVSSKFLGSYTFPHLGFNKERFDISKDVKLGTFAHINSLNEIDTSVMNSLITRATARCEFVGYFQFAKTDYSRQQLREIDEELNNPTGRPIPKIAPRIEIDNFTLYSPDCAIILQKENTTSMDGPLRSTYMLGIKKLLGVLGLLTSIQLGLFLRQMKLISTPGQLSNISSSTLTLISRVDIIFIMTASFSIDFLSKDLYILPVSLTVLFLITAIFEIRFLINVMVNQNNERGISWWEILRSSRARNNERRPQEGSEGVELEPQPAEGTPSETQTSDTAADRATFKNLLLAKFLFIGIISLFFLVQVTRMRRSFKIVFEWIFYTFINSYWIPQFLRNTLKNKRRAFSWEFMINLSIIRIMPLYYCLVYKHNALDHHQDIPLAIFVTLWVGIQLVLLYLQDRIGARFWIKDNWLPKAYDYHPLLNVSDLETGFSSDIIANIHEIETNRNDSDLVKCKVDCTICMTDVDFPVKIKTETKDDKLPALERAQIQDYMVTPCHHIFHSECLEDWMKYKLKCPVCRNPLPPI